jgi:hypothetical protein
MADTGSSQVAVCAMRDVESSHSVHGLLSGVITICRHPRRTSKLVGMLDLRFSRRYL